MKKGKIDTILFFSAHVDKWGAERSTCSLAAYLQELGYRVLFVIPSKGPIIDIFVENNLQYIVLPFYKWIRQNNIFKALIKGCYYRVANLSLALRLHRILKKMNMNPVLVYSNTIVFGMGILFSLIYRIPHIQHIRENVYTFGMKFFFGYSITLKMISAFSKMIICTCRSVRDVYLPLVKKGNITYQYNGIPITDKPKMYGASINQEIVCFIVVARLDEDKRIMDVAKAVKILLDRKIRNFRVDVYGEGSQRADIEQYITDNQIGAYIVLKGFQKSIDYNMYSVGVLASTFEAFARSVLEYMMNGLAVIGSNSGGTMEQVIDKETGFLYEPHNANQLADKMEYMVTHKDECRLMGLKGRDKVESCFSQDRYVKGVSRVIIDQLK